MSNNKKETRKLSSAVFYFPCEFRDEFMLLSIFLEEQLLILQKLTMEKASNIKFEKYIVGIGKINEAIQFAFSCPL